MSTRVGGRMAGYMDRASTSSRRDAYEDGWKDDRQHGQENLS